MMCDRYEKYELGQIDQTDFETHVADCPTCQQLLRKDDALLMAAQSLNRTVHAPLLWAKIENSLRQEKQHHNRRNRVFESENTKQLFRVAALLVVVVGIGLVALLYRKPDNLNNKVLTRAALKRVERVQEEHAEAIVELQRIAEPKLAGMDLDLMLLYRDRLQTIDAQIARCKEALQDNPANAHIRRYMLAALEDKKETLVEIIQFKSGS